MRKIKIALLQLSTKLGAVEENKVKIIEGLEKAKKEKANIAVTPELATLGYGSGDIYLDKVRENLISLEEIKEHTNDIIAVIGYVEKDKNGFFYNAAKVFYNKKEMGNYRKVQLVNYRLFDEKRYFKPGNRLPVYTTPFGRFGILICEDLWFPEPSRAMAFRGAEFLITTGASPYEIGKEDIWINFLRQRVYDNILPIVFCNQAGCQDGVTYLGSSMFMNAKGELVQKGKIIEEDFIVCEIDLEEYERIRRRDIRLREVRREILDELLRAYSEMQNE